MPPFTEDFSEFTDTDELAHAATISGHGTVNGILSREYVDDGQIAGNRPIFGCAESDVSGITRSTAVTVGGSNYTVIDIQPDGTGWVRLVLNE